MNQCLRAEGSALLSMIGMGAGGVLNCVLDPIFIVGLDLGVAGASMATAISKLVSFGILIFPYLTHHSILRISIKNFHPTRDIMSQIIKVGSSSMFRSGLAVVAAIMLNNLAGQISDDVLAGIGVSTRIMMFPFGIILGFGTGFQPVVGFCWGAKHYDRVRAAFRFSAWTAAIGGGIMGLLVAVFAGPIIAMFGKSSQEMLEIGELCIRLQCLALPIHGWVAVVNMLCAGLGDARGALLLSTARQGSCFIPIVHLMALPAGSHGSGLGASRGGYSVSGSGNSGPAPRDEKDPIDGGHPESAERSRPPSRKGATIRHTAYSSGFYAEKKTPTAIVGVFFSGTQLHPGAFTLLQGQRVQRISSLLEFGKPFSFLGIISFKTPFS